MNRLDFQAELKAAEEREKEASLLKAIDAEAEKARLEDAIALGIQAKAYLANPLTQLISRLQWDRAWEALRKTMAAPTAEECWRWARYADGIIKTLREPDALIVLGDDAAEKLERMEKGDANG